MKFVNGLFLNFIIFLLFFLYLFDHDEIGQNQMKLIYPIAKNLLVQIEKLILIGPHLTWYTSMVKDCHCKVGQ